MGGGEFESDSEENGESSMNSYNLGDLFIILQKILGDFVSGVHVLHR